MTAAQFRTVQQPLDPTTAVGEIALFDADGNPLDLSGGGQKSPASKPPRSPPARLPPRHSPMGC